MKEVKLCSLRLPKKHDCVICGKSLTNYNYTSHFSKHSLSSLDYFSEYGMSWWTSPRKTHTRGIKKSILKSNLGKLSKRLNRLLRYSDIKLHILAKIICTTVDTKCALQHISNMIDEYVAGKYFTDLNHIEFLVQYTTMLTYTGKQGENYDWYVVRYGKDEAIKRTTAKSDRYSGKNNPAYNHGGKYSALSENFIHADKTDIQSVKDKISIANKENGNNKRCLNYWLEETDDNEELAKKLLSDHQTTFSLEVCITKHGEVEGRKTWQERQDKWLKTLDQKSDEEKAAINKKKTSSGYSISRAELELNKYFNEFNLFPETQFSLFDNKRSYVYDFKLDNKIIEYNGDYWHMNPLMYESDDFNGRGKYTASEKWNRDKIKLEIAINAGYDVLVIWENDYNNDKESTVEKCLNFLTQ